MSRKSKCIDSQIFAHRFYHEAPNDVFELLVMLFSDVNENGWGKGGLNVLRLVEWSSQWQPGSQAVSMSIHSLLRPSRDARGFGTSDVTDSRAWWGALMDSRASELK